MLTCAAIGLAIDVIVVWALARGLEDFGEGWDWSWY